MGTPFISVIIPTHDRPDELAVALASLAGQSFTDFEAVVVNDGAQDVADVVGRSPLKRVRLLRTVGDLGPSLARNAGLAEARGQVVAYLDDDDIYRPDHLAVHAECYDEDPELRVAYTDGERLVIGETGQVLDRPHSRDFDADALLVQNYIPVICLSHYRACLDETGLFEPSLTYLEDWDLFIRLALRWPFRHVPRVTTLYRERRNGGSVRERHACRFVESLNTVYARSAALLAGDPARLERVTDLRLTRVGEMTYVTGQAYEQAGDRVGALHAYELAARYEPRPEYYLAQARIHKGAGNKAAALMAARLAEDCRLMSGAGAD
ncbi:MAG: glycosyltransferase [Pseudodesulfovibrio sp.]